MADSSKPAPQPAVTSKNGSSKWLTLAISSGTFAAFNGAFAKLTTTAKTHNLAVSVSDLLGFEANSTMVELLIRAAFLGLNLLSNTIMWVLFTRALTASTGATRVSVLNTSANFIVTALLGMLIFDEKLPLGWWAGAALLVAGSVIIGAREGAEQKPGASEEMDKDAGRIAVKEGAPGVGGGVGGRETAAGVFRESEDGYRDETS